MECAAKGKDTVCSGPPLLPCTRCKAVAYCSLSHQMLHRGDHEKECGRLEDQMKNASILNKFPFTFCEEATFQICERQETRCSFLAKRGLHQLGMWSYECSCRSSNVLYNPSLLLKDWNLSSVFCPCKDPICPLSKQLKGWKEYYEWRSITLDSPVALLLHWSLTIYHAVQLNACRVNAREGGKRINIHYLGPDKELFQIASFGELHALFPNCDVHLELVGPAVPSQRDGERINLDCYGQCEDKVCKCKIPSEDGRSTSVSVRLLKGLYHDRFRDIIEDSFPHMIIAPNAGLAAYPSWIETLELIHMLNIPAVFSDFCEEAAHLASCCLNSITGSQLVVPIQLNPFRQPLAIEDSALYLPCYSNCFIFGI